MKYFHVLKLQKDNSCILVCSSNLSNFASLYLWKYSIFITYRNWIYCSPLAWFFISEKFIEILILLKTNKELIHTIKTVLQVFPEGVIIRSLDETSAKTITKFANEYAKDIFKTQQITEQTLNRVSVILSSEELKEQGEASVSMVVSE